MTRCTLPQDAYIKGVGMMTDREKLEALVWRRMPASRKVSAGGVKWVSVGGKLVTLASVSDSDLFTVLTRAAVVKVALANLEAA